MSESEVALAKFKTVAKSFALDSSFDAIACGSGTASNVNMPGLALASSISFSTSLR